MFEHRTFGHYLKLSVRGASHAPAISFRLEGMPSDFTVDRGKLSEFMARRAPGRDAFSTARRENDIVDLSHRESMIEGVIRNTDVRPGDYGAERTVPRPGHADFGQWVEMGRIPTGGGANSGRMTAALCAAGGICKQWLESRGIVILAEPVRIGKECNPKRWKQAILAAKEAGDSVGGEICCQIVGVQAGIGGALFAGLESELSAALFAIPGVKGVAFGNGFASARMLGSKNNEAFEVEDGFLVTTRTDRHGGILGGRATGCVICFNVAMKPTPTIYKTQDSVDLETMKPAKLTMKGRHDPCIVPRAVPVVEAMAAFALADAILATEAAHPRICLTLTGKTIAEDLAQYRSQYHFVDLVEIRADLLSEYERENRLHDLVESLCAPTIITLRRECEGGALKTDDPHAASEFYIRFITSIRVRPSCPLYFDVDSDAYTRELEQFVIRNGFKMIRSHHAFDGKPEDLVWLFRSMHDDCSCIPKIAFMPRSLNEVAAACAEMNSLRGFPYLLCVMGAQGLVSRAWAGMSETQWTYSSVGGLEGIGHVSPRELVRTYRLRQQTHDYALYGVTGWPLAATRSPEINNIAWADADEDNVMVPFPAETAMDAVAYFKAMKMRGMAVTSPHKQTIMPLLDYVSVEAREIGAVNTVKLERGLLVGYNTDAIGFSRAIRAFVGREDFAGVSVAVLGAGGASRAVVHALTKLGANVKVFHRATLRRRYDLIVNATPVDPIPKYSFAGTELVYDLVYVPAETSLMARARAAGCRVENGLSMLVAQAEEQRRIWRMP